MSNKHVPAQLAVEFKAIVCAAMRGDPDVMAWRFDGIIVEGVTPGRFESKYWAPDRVTMIQLACHTVELRAARWDGRRVRPPIEEWREVMRAEFDLRTDISVGAGWRDLLTAALEISGNGAKIVQIKEKFGTLRSYGIGDIGLYVDHLSGCVCEVCGAPGQIRRSEGWYSTRCDAHVRKSPWDEDK